MSALGENLSTLCEDLSDRLEAGEKPTFDDYALMGFVQYRIAPLLIAKQPRRDRLSEIIADMNSRVDAGMMPTEEELLFADELDMRIKWVDTLHEAGSILESVGVATDETP